MESRAVAVWQRREVLNLLIRRDLKVKYQQSMLGYVWTLVEPLMFAGIYWFVFAKVFHRHGPDSSHGAYILYLVSGLLMWNWFNGNLRDSTKAIKSQAKLITTMKVPREVFPVGVVGAHLIEFLLSLPVLVIFIFVGHGHFTRSLVWIPCAMALMLILNTGLNMLVSALNIVLRDVERIVNIVLRALFYLSPVVYTVGNVKSAARHQPIFARLYEANPLVGILQLQHAAFYPSEFPAREVLIISASGCVLIFLFGWWMFRLLEPAVLKEL